MFGSEARLTGKGCQTLAFVCRASSLFSFLSLCSKNSIVILSSVLSFYNERQRLAVWLVAYFEALSYQVTTTFDKGGAARIRTAPAINYTACWQLVFILFCLFVNYLAFVFKSFSICTNLSTKHKFILFF